MKLRTISLIMALIMACAVLFSCGDGGKKPKETRPSKSTSSDTSTASQNDFQYIDDYVNGLAADANLAGKTFTVLTNAGGWPEFDEITGNLDSDAKYNVNRELEEKFGITMDKIIADEGDFETTGAHMADMVFKDVMAGGSSYDLVNANMMTCGQVMINSGSSSAVEDMAPLDFSRSWWMKDMEEKLQMSGHIYLMTGKIAHTHYSTPTGILFNKTLATDFKIEDLYQLVRDGDWTFDKMTEVASVIPSGGGLYQLTTGGASGGLAFYFGAGYTISGRDADGNPTIAEALTSDKVDFIDKARAYLGDTSKVFNGVLMRDKLGLSSDELEDYSFDKGNILFSSAAIGLISQYREKDIEFGVLPVPKADKAQKEYISLSSAWTVNGVFFSKNLSDPDMSATITEAMAALSEKYLEPAFLEKALKGRSTYDFESRDMVDLLYNTAVIDLADTYQWGKLVDVVNDNILGEKENLASDYGTTAKLANKEIARLLKTIEKNNK